MPKLPHEQMFQTGPNGVLRHLMNGIPKVTAAALKPTPKNVWYYTQGFAKYQLESYNNSIAKVTRQAFFNPRNPHRMFTKAPPKDEDDFPAWQEENIEVIKPPVRLVMKLLVIDVLIWFQ